MQAHAEGMAHGGRSLWRVPNRAPKVYGRTNRKVLLISQAKGQGNVHFLRELIMKVISFFLCSECAPVAHEIFCSKDTYTIFQEEVRNGNGNSDGDGCK